MIASYEQSPRGEGSSEGLPPRLFDGGLEEIREEPLSFLYQLGNFSRNDKELLRACKRFDPRFEEGSDRSYVLENENPPYVISIALISEETRKSSGFDLGYLGLSHSSQKNLELMTRFVESTGIALREPSPAQLAEMSRKILEYLGYIM